MVGDCGLWICSILKAFAEFAERVIMVQVMELVFERVSIIHCWALSTAFSPLKVTQQVV